MGSTFYSKRYKWRKDRNRSKRPKTFRTEERAKEYAREMLIENFKIEKLSERKFRIKV